MLCISFLIQKLKVEYMVVAFDEDNKDVKLSLRQTEILEKLSTIVGDISSECDKS